MIHSQTRADELEDEALIGRSEELEHLTQWAKDGASLISVIGPPGVGKTSLLRALTLVPDLLCDHQLDSQTLFIELAQARTMEDMLEKLYDALPRGSVDLDKAPNIGDFADALSRCTVALLVLDNFEQLLPTAAAAVNALCEALPDLCILISSRQCLGLRKERIFELAPLATPASEGIEDDAILACAASRLFIARAQRLDPNFDADTVDLAIVADVVRRLDGLPLAIELVAARLRLMSLESIANRLARDSANLIAGGHGGHRRILEGSVLSSWELLSPPEQRALAILSVFRGKFDLEPAEHIIKSGGAGEASDPLALLQRLRDCSLVARDPDTNRLFLYEYIREFAAGRLHNDGLTEQATLAHARYYADLADQLARAYEDRGSHSITEAIAAQRDQLRAAHERLSGPSFADRPDLKSLRWRLIDALGIFIERHAGREQREQFLQRIEETSTLEDLAAQAPTRTLWRILTLLHLQGDSAREQHLIDLARAPESPFDAALLTMAQVRLYVTLGKHDEVLRLTSELLERPPREHSRLLRIRILLARGNAHYWLQDLTSARDAWEQAQQQCTAGIADYYEAVAVTNLCFVNNVLGDKHSALQYGRRAIELFRATGDRRGEGTTLGYLGMIDLDYANCEGALEQLLEARELHKWSGNEEHECFALANLSTIERLRNRHAQSELYLSESDTMSRKLQLPLVPVHNAGLRADLHIARGDLPQAATLLDQALAMDEISKHPNYISLFESRRAAIAMVLGQKQAALESFERARIYLENLSQENYQRACGVYRATGLTPDSPDRAPLIGLLADTLRTHWSREDQQGSGFKPAYHNSLMVREAVEFVWPTLDEPARRHIEALARDPACRALIVSPSFDLFRLPGGSKWCDISGRQNLIGLLSLLTRAHERRDYVDESTITATLWPNEIIEAAAATNRIHNAIALLRRAGLKPLLLRSDSGYHLDLTEPIIVLEGRLTPQTPAASRGG